MLLPIPLPSRGKGCDNLALSESVTGLVIETRILSLIPVTPVLLMKRNTTKSVSQWCMAVVWEKSPMSG